MNRYRYSGKAKDLIFGLPFGNVYPPRGLNVNLIPIDDPRTAALRVLALYISELTFYRPGVDGGPPVPFSIPLENIHIESPNNDEDVVLPAIVFTQDNDEDYQSIGFNSDLEEDSADVFAPNTVLQVQYDQVEEFGVEIWANNKPERRSIIAGLQTAMVPTEAMYGIRFRMPGYFNQMVTFVANSYRRPDDQAVRGRRIGTLRVEMTFNVVNLVHYVPLIPSVVVNPIASDDPNYLSVVFEDEVPD